MVDSDFINKAEFILVTSIIAMQHRISVRSLNTV